MARPTILVTGATGKTGAAVVTTLREEGYPVRAVVHARGHRSAALERLGAEIVVADLFDPEQMRAAAQGTARAYFAMPFHPHMLHAASAFAIAARDARIEHIVSLSQWIASPSHPSFATRQVWLADELLATLPGSSLTIVNPGYFADNYLRMMPFAAQLGIFPAFVGDSRNAPPSNEDIARVAAAALMDPARHAGKTYRPTGPALLTTTEMAAILGEVVGHRVRKVEIPTWLLLKSARMQGESAFSMSGFLHYITDHKQGAFEFGAPTDDVLVATGQPAESFETAARRYASRPEAQQTVGNRLRAFLEFMVMPMMPGYDIPALERAWELPMPATPRYSLENAEWKAARAAQVGRPTVVERRFTSAAS